MILSNIIQIILSLLLLIILLLISNFIFQYESILNIKNANSLKREEIIFDGIMDLTRSQWSYDTYNKSLLSFKDLSPSINQNGGAEYSYNFWLYMDKAKLKSINSSDVVLLLRGSKITVPYINNTNCEIFSKGEYVLVKNPLIRMKSDGTAIIVEYNTLTNPDSYRENGNNMISCSSASWYDKNKGLLGIYNLNDYTYDKKWYMFTVVLKEISPDNDILYKNKTSCKMYINGINVLDRVVESPYNGAYGSAAMKHNRTPLYINPGDLYSLEDSKKSSNPFNTNNGTNGSVLMANLSYFNYALTDLEVSILFNRKFSKAAAVPPLDNQSDGITDPYAIAPVSENGNNLPLAF